LRFNNLYDRVSAKESPLSKEDRLYLVMGQEVDE
jgi:hypothetical protein